MLKFKYESQLLTGMIAGADRPSVSWGNFFDATASSGTHVRMRTLALGINLKSLAV
ncbi:hypothetical protein [Funiculus sociatus]|uniref:hypothetical protein n=1 Tax=Funiculus sociatus TaxID=450527 RepID=UPI0016858247|nr:hypothetical protein [Trichocoleus sp. FACHB-69]